MRVRLRERGPASGLFEGADEAIARNALAKQSRGLGGDRVRLAAERGVLLDPLRTRLQAIERDLALGEHRHRDRGAATRDLGVIPPLLERREAFVEPRGHAGVGADDLMDQRMRQLVSHDREVALALHVLKVDDDRALSRKGDAAICRCEEAGIRRPDTEELL